MMTLENCLADWVENGGNLRDALRSFGDQRVTSVSEVNAVVNGLRALREKPSRVLSEKDWLSTPLHHLIGFFQAAEGKEVFEAFQEDGLPELRFWVDSAIAERKVDETAIPNDDVLFALKVLSMYRQQEDIQRIAKAAHSRLDDGFLWTLIFRSFNKKHPFALEMVDSLRGEIPSGFVGVAYLDMANQLAISGVLTDHPFDDEQGRAKLRSFLTDDDEKRFSYAGSAATALPFLSEPYRQELLALAYMHVDATVRIEAFWAGAKLGDEQAVKSLSELCLDFNHSRVACAYLKEIDKAEAIPSEATSPSFAARAEMAAWLSHPSEFGRAPQKIELYDERQLYWPPTEDIRDVYLVKYTYSDRDEIEIGVGMVGSTTFALLDEATADLPAEDLYGLHCCWELQMGKSGDAPDERSAEVGRKILSEHNPGF